MSPVDSGADASTALSSSSGKNDFPQSTGQSSAASSSSSSGKDDLSLSTGQNSASSSTPGPVATADKDLSSPGSTHNVNGNAARMTNSSAGNGEQKPRSEQGNNLDLADL